MLLISSIWLTLLLRYWTSTYPIKTDGEKMSGRVLLFYKLWAALDLFTTFLKVTDDILPKTLGGLIPLFDLYDRSSSAARYGVEIACMCMHIHTHCTYSHTTITFSPKHFTFLWTWSASSQEILLPLPFCLTRQPIFSCSFLGKIAFPAYINW